MENKETHPLEALKILDSVVKQVKLDRDEHNYLASLLQTLQNLYYKHEAIQAEFNTFKDKHAPKTEFISRDAVDRQVPSSENGRSYN